ncbi:MAG: hypothetical protein HXX08_13535 [Chloroflexi bacterium]|uniref:Uncharacterized protein n=1 Tax=Candidatus Chlorohelix allophototropha TaxID=3003348 RepID=A0A8T7M481_9CHLR|nr:hypothetical protein [Chloroflexota bacterium]WJW70132.1 hypothetical protein OZ401_004638 [Chloroflexota bacterium L227-S17]
MRGRRKIIMHDMFEDVAYTQFADYEIEYPRPAKEPPKELSKKNILPAIENNLIGNEICSNHTTTHDN